MKQFITDRLNQAYSKSKTHKYDPEDWVTEEWNQIKVSTVDQARNSGVDIARLRDLGLKISSLPEDKNFHRLVKKIFEQRVKTIEDGEGIDWGTSEALAFASLIQEGYNVRISGQDVQRGTFSHRHAHVYYQDQDGYYIPID
jgi:2-oxoglutarate dehydrogenase E1 component